MAGIKWLAFWIIVICGRGLNSISTKKSRPIETREEDGDPAKIFQLCLFGEKEKLKRIFSKYREFININERRDGNTPLHLGTVFESYLKGLIFRTIISFVLPI